MGMPYNLLSKLRLDVICLEVLKLPFDDICLFVRLWKHLYSCTCVIQRYRS